MFDFFICLRSGLFLYIRAYIGMLQLDIFMISSVNAANKPFFKNARKLKHLAI